MLERDVDPSVYRTRLRNTLRRMRESRKITQTIVAEEMSWSVSKLIRIEQGTVTISVNDLKALLAYYDVTEPDTVGSLVEMARNSRKPSWLRAYRDIANDTYLAFLGHEDTAIRSHSFQPILVPGLLQTDEYAAEVVKVTRGSKDPRRLNGLVALRLARQKRVLARNGALTLNYVLDESVVRRVVGGPAVMRRQISHLIDSCQRADLSLRILPFRVGVFRSMRVPFVVLEFSDPEDETILYLEYPQGEQLTRENGPPEEGGAAGEPSPPTTPLTYLQIFEELHGYTSEAETLSILQSALAALDDAPGGHAPAPATPPPDDR
jgi:transcriptional regulator with XRE-family HTH domain